MLLCPWDFPGKSTGVGCHFLLRGSSQPKDRSWVSCVVGRCLTVLTTREVDKKAFLSNQCKEIEENNRMGKTRDLFKKIRDTKGIFHAKMGLIKDRKSMDLTEAEDIKKRKEEYTEELYKKDLHNPDNHDDVITHIIERQCQRMLKLLHSCTHLTC